VVLPVAARDAPAASGGEQGLGAPGPDVAAEPGVAADVAADVAAEQAGLPAAADVAAAGQGNAGPGDRPVLGAPAVRAADPGLTGGPAWVVSKDRAWAAPRDLAWAAHPGQAVPGVAQPAVVNGSQAGPVCREHCRGGSRPPEDGFLQA